MFSSSSSNLAKLLALMTEEEIATFLAAKEATKKQTPSQTTPDSAAVQQPPTQATPSKAPSSKPEEEKIEQILTSPSEKPESSPAKAEPSKQQAAFHFASSPDPSTVPTDPTTPKSTSHTSPPQQKLTTSSPTGQTSSPTHIQISSEEKEEALDPLAHLEEELPLSLPFLQPPADQGSISKKAQGILLPSSP